MIIFHPVECCSCGIPFGLTVLFEEHRREDRNWFYCPNGHPQHYVFETEAERLQRELHAEKKKTATLVKQLETCQLKIRKRGSNGRFLPRKAAKI